MIDHITLPVSDLQKSKAFYKKALAPLGYKMFYDENDVPYSAGFGTEDVEGKRDWWITEDPEKVRGSEYCIAFKASSKEMVEEFYEQALEAGGKDNGAPGYRKQYSPGYYASFVYDPDGYNIEAVFDEGTK